MRGGSQAGKLVQGGHILHVPPLGGGGDRYEVRARAQCPEVLLAECPASKEIQELAAEYGIHKTRFKVENPEEQCMLCGLCVRACQEVVGVRAISFGSRGVHKHVATPYMVPNQACIACGSCVTVCPTGAMQARLDKVRGDISERTGHGFAH